MKLVDHIQGSPAWHAWRANIIGGSDAAAILGCGYMTPYQLYLNKLGLYSVEVTDRMRRGQELEEEARQLFMKEFNKKVRPACGQSEEYPFLGASLDGLSEDGTFIFEVKTGSQGGLDKIRDTGQLPEKHIAQIQHNLLVFELDRCEYMYYHPEDNRGQYALYATVRRSTQYIDQYIPQARTFWRNLLNFVPPPLTDDDYNRQSGSEWMGLVRELLPLQERISRDDKREKEIRDRLIEISGDQSSTGGGVKLSRIPRQGTIDYKAIPELENVDLEKYRKPPIITWRLTTKD